MKKLLAVVLVALLSVGAFAAVNFSGSLDVTNKLTYTPGATPSELKWEVTPSGSVSISASGSDEITGFSATINWDGKAEGYVWWKPYVSEALTIQLNAGTIDGKGQVQSVFTLKPSDDLKDTLTVSLYPNAYKPAYLFELDVSNKLEFMFLTLTTTVKEVVKNAEAAKVDLAAGVTLDAAKLLGIADATLKFKADFGIKAPDAQPLKSWSVGADFGIDKYKGSVSFNHENKLTAKLETTLLAPVTIGGSVTVKTEDPVGSMELNAYAKWTLGVLSNTLSLGYNAATKGATVSLTNSVSF
ncbi:hypothetical protein [Pseudothermotoga thermarum]|uniref:Uncharacterized protein n=1 Tax=Pseudothermotoga thermarum DSM 5069 TaxID=688269 RepID=F7YWD3_9THEM|nr:hypothetical protein [Pseudothermotoga thermarum]AEH51911.1 hypothetical protein Theth_1870 [Pseudothermotoga thermarum DSM 5069]